MKNMRKSSKYILGVLGILTILIPVILSFKNFFDVDSSVILSEMERIADGYIPYKTMHLNYPPLWFYMMVGLKNLFNVPYGCYAFYLVVHYIFSIGCAWLVYAISKEFGAKKWTSLFAAWMMLVISQWMYGDRVLFEIPSIFFGLLASFLALKYRDRSSVLFLIVGFISSLPFLVKQFGAGYIVLVAYLVIAFCENNRWQKCIWYVLGASLPIITCILIFGNDFIQSVLFNGYGGEEVRAIAGDTSNALQRIVGGAVYYCIRIPIIPLSIVFCPLFISDNKWKELLFCLFGFGGFMLQMAFIMFVAHKFTPEHYHYLLYVLPFSSILSALILSMSGSRLFRILSYATVGYICLYSLYKIARYCIPGYLSDKLEQQYEMADKVKAAIKDGKTVWIVDLDLEYLYYLCNLKTGDMKDFAYSTAIFEVTPAKAESIMKKVDYVLHFDTQGEPPWWHSYYVKEVQDYIYSHPMQVVDEKENIVVHLMKENLTDADNR